MQASLLVFGLIIAFVVGGLMTFRADAKRPLPDHLPPPLTDDDSDQDDDDRNKHPKP